MWICLIRSTVELCNHPELIINPGEGKHLLSCASSKRIRNVVAWQHMLQHISTWF